MSTRSEAAHSIATSVVLALVLAGCAPAPPAGPGEAATARPATAPIPPQPGPTTGPTTGARQAPAGGAAVGTRHASPSSLPGWADDGLEGLAGAIERQCALARPPSPWPGLCDEFRAQRTTLREWIERRFRVQPLSGSDGSTEGLITGYFEAELDGSRRRASAQQVPLYRRPPQALLAARPTRARIEGSSLLAGHELVWIDDPVEAFFLQIQGSGRVRLREGGTMRVGYEGNNGQPYRAIGRVLVERGAMAASEVDAESIKAWLRAHPKQAREVMHENPRYIFFRELPPTPDDTGPPGSLGIALTPLRSVAVDPARVPPGALLFLDTTNPVDGRALRRVVVAQDTGAAIVGPVRADLFWGHGPDARRAAGLMKQRGRLWQLVPRD